MADEYANIIEKHGYWKDSAIVVEGKAAWSLTLMFLEMWELCTKRKECFEDFYPFHLWQEAPCLAQEGGFVQPYADSPMDNENVGEHVYLQILNNAKRYVYITTPYLIVDDSNAVMQVKEDFLNTLTECEEITLERCNGNPITRLFQNLLRLVAPLL